MRRIPRGNHFYERTLENGDITYYLYREDETLVGKAVVEDEGTKALVVMTPEGQVCAVGVESLGQAALFLDGHFNAGAEEVGT